MSASTRLYLLRHAEVEVRYHRVFGGSIDMGLSPAGHEQAARLSDFFQHHPLDAIYASPMRRVQETLKPLAARTGLVASILPGLREVDFGIWTGLTWDQVFEQHKINAYEWLHQIDRSTIPEAECPRAWRQRVSESLGRILAEQEGRTVAVVCHGGVIRMALCILLELPLPKTAHFDIEYAGITCVDRQLNKTDLRFMNIVPWRDLR